MATSTVDAPRPAGAEPAPPGTPPAGPEIPLAPDPVGRACARCGAPLADGQDWCLQCGSGAPGSLGTPAWRPAAWALALALVLVLGAAAAGYAALNSSPPARRVLTTTVASAPAVTPPAATTPGTTTPPGSIPPITAKPPKIPLTAVTPKTPTVAKTTPATTTPSTTKTTPANTGGESAGEAPSSSAILLDTNAASTYNPYSLPAAAFGDPSLSIDGDTSTGWTAQVQPETAPGMAVGLLVDLKTAQKLAAIRLATSTPGMTIQLYGANGSTPPTSITDPGWSKLSHSIVVHRRHAHLKLREATHSFRYVALWISKAPASSVGTAQAPGHVSVNELELFPAH